MKEIKEKLARKLAFVPSFIFIILGICGLLLILNQSDPDSNNAQIWSATYQIIAWFGALYGLYYSGLWGGRKSLMGRANLAFAFGLLAQSFGQIVFSYQTYIGAEALYPSLADLGFFGSIPLYIYGIVMLTKASGAHLSLKSFLSKIQAFLIPVIILVLSYLIFLKDYEFDWSQPLTVILDFGYPLGQAIYVSLAIVAYMLSRNFLGGVMRKPLLLFIFALFAQYVADYAFLYQISRDYYFGQYIILNDFLYMIAYFMMAMSLIRLGSVFYKIKNT